MLIYKRTGEALVHKDSFRTRVSQKVTKLGKSMVEMETLLELKRDYKFQQLLLSKTSNQQTGHKTPGG